jgi:hypothetical protein
LHSKRLSFTLVAASGLARRWKSWSGNLELLIYGKLQGHEIIKTYNINGSEKVVKQQVLTHTPSIEVSCLFRAVRISVKTSFPKNFGCSERTLDEGTQKSCAKISKGNPSKQGQ